MGFHGPIDANSQHIASLLLGKSVMREMASRTEARRRADGPVLAGRHPLGLRASRTVPRERRLHKVLKGQAPVAFPESDLWLGMVEPSAPSCPPATSSARGPALGSSAPPRGGLPESRPICKGSGTRPRRSNRLGGPRYHLLDSFPHSRGRDIVNAGHAVLSRAVIERTTAAAPEDHPRSREGHRRLGEASAVHKVRHLKAHPTGPGWRGSSANSTGRAITERNQRTTPIQEVPTHGRVKSLLDHPRS